jgi:hypothetical protein
MQDLKGRLDHIRKQFVPVDAVKLREYSIRKIAQKGRCQFILH